MPPGGGPWHSGPRVLRLPSRLCNDRAHGGGERRYPTRDVPEPPVLSPIGPDGDGRGEFPDVIPRGELIILTDSLGGSLPSLIEVKLAQNEVVLRVVGE